MTDPLDDAALTALARSAQGGDDDALHAFLRALMNGGQLRPPIRRFLFADDDVQLAEQQALVAVSTKLNSWSGGESVMGWARQIAANEAKMVIRSRERRRSYEDAAANRTAEFVERMSSHLATAADVERCMAELEEQQREALRLRSEGLSYADVAAALGLPEGTVKTRVRLARKALAEMLANLTER